jgi:hypothetical protein
MVFLHQSTTGRLDDSGCHLPVEARRKQTKTGELERNSKETGSVRNDLVSASNYVSATGT